VFSADGFHKASFFKRPGLRPRRIFNATFLKLTKIDAVFFTAESTSAQVLRIYTDFSTIAISSVYFIGQPILL